MSRAGGGRGGETRLPVATRRLFPGFEAAGEDLDPETHAPYILGRLLEDGDRTDLAWLARTYGRERLATWVRERSDRQLSRRSHTFWRLVLELETPDRDRNDRAAETLNAFWPL